MRRDTAGRRRASAVVTPLDSMLEPRCPHAPAPTALPYGLRYWITGGLGALGVGLALSFSAGTAAAAPADGNDGGTTSSSSTSPSRPDRTSAATGSDRAGTSTGRANPGRKSVRTVRTAGPTARATAESSSEPTESDEETVPVAEPGSGDGGTVPEPVDQTTSAPDTDSDTDSTSGAAPAGEKSSSATTSGRPSVTSASRQTAAKSVDEDAGEQSGVTVSAASLRTVAAGASVPAEAAVTAAGAPAIPGAAALVNGRVVVGTIIVDILNGFGLPVPGQWARLVPINLPSQIEVWWFTARRSIYGGVGPDPGGPGQPGNPGGLTLLWETNFTDREEAMRYWTYQTGRWGASAGDNQYYTDGANDFIDADGNLVIEARRETPPDGAGAPYNYTSARMVTLDKQTVSVGSRIVARIQMPTDQGTLPAFWTLGAEPGHEYNFPRQGEIDIIELAGQGTEASKQTWVGNLHGPAHWDENVEIKIQGLGGDLGEPASNGFREYGIDWHSDRIVWHIDGVEVAQYTQQQWEALGGDWTPFSGAYDHYLVLNIAVGNNWTGDPPADQPFHSQMKVDWVKVYSLDSVTV